MDVQEEEMCVCVWRGGGGGRGEGGGGSRSVSWGLRPDVGARKIFNRKFMLMSQPGTHPGVGSRASRYCRTAGTTHVEIYEEMRYALLELC